MRIKYFLTDWLDQFLMAFATLAMGYACNGLPKDMPRPAAGAIKQSNWAAHAASPDGALFSHTQFSQAPDTEHFILYRSLRSTHFYTTRCRPSGKHICLTYQPTSRLKACYACPCGGRKNQQPHCPMCVCLLTI